MKQIWKIIDFSFQNWHEEFDKFWPGHSKVPKICTLMGSFWTKYIMFELKKFRGAMSNDTEKSCKIWRKTDLRFGKWHEEFGKFLREHWKVSKLGFWWDPFIQSRKCLSLKFTEELCIMTRKNLKIWRGIDSLFQNVNHNLTNFDPSTRMSQKFAL